jgi:hypothetical protein
VDFSGPPQARQIVLKGTFSGQLARDLECYILNAVTWQMTQNEAANVTKLDKKPDQGV